MSGASTPVDVRDEDAFDVESMAIWLRANASDAGGLTGRGRCGSSPGRINLNGIPVDAS